MKKILVMLLMVSMLVGSLAGCSNGNKEDKEVTNGNNTEATDSDDKEAKNNKLYFVTLNDQGPYWMPLIDSAKKTAADNGYDLVVKAGVAGDPSRPQRLLEAVQEGIDQEVAGMALAALDPEMFDDKALEVKNNGIKLVTFDTDIATPENRLSYIGTDNYQAGAVLGKKSAEDMLQKGITSGSVTTITYSGSVQNMVERYQGLQDGFKEAMGENAENFTWLEWIINDLSASEAKRQLEAQMISNEDLKAVFTLGTESVITGAMEAIKSQNKQGVVLHYGFDYSDTFLSGIEDKLITAIVDQNCAEIGRTIINTLISSINNEEVESVYPIDVNWVVADELEEYGNKKLNK